MAEEINFFPAKFREDKISWPYVQEQELPSDFICKIGF